MLLDQSECRNLGPETEASIFMRATSVALIDSSPPLFDVRCHGEMRQLGDLVQLQLFLLFQIFGTEYTSHRDSFMMRKVEL